MRTVTVNGPFQMRLRLIYNTVRADLTRKGLFNSRLRGVDNVDSVDSVDGDDSDVVPHLGR